MVKYRHLAWVIIFSIITFGIYAIYWLVMTSMEQKELKIKNPPNPMYILYFVLASVIGMILASVGTSSGSNVFLILGWIFYLISFVISVIFYWRYSVGIEKISNGKFNRWLLFIFFILFSLVSIIISQIALNKKAKKKK